MKREVLFGTFPSEKKTGLPIHMSRWSWKFSTGTTQKVVFHLHPNTQRHLYNFSLREFLQMLDLLFSAILGRCDRIQDRQNNRYSFGTTDDFAMWQRVPVALQYTCTKA